jgi:hypothetical protein
MLVASMLIQNGLAVGSRCSIDPLIITMCYVTDTFMCYAKWILGYSWTLFIFWLSHRDLAILSVCGQVMSSWFYQGSLAKAR